MSAARDLRARRIEFGIGAAYLLLAYLSSRAGETLAAVQLLYVLPMTYAMLQLDRTRFVVLGAFALITHCAALFLPTEGGHSPNQTILWIQISALACLYAWTGYAAGLVRRLRTRLREARRRLYDLGHEASDRASRDALTGAYHQRQLMEALEREIARAERVGKPVSIARVDLDWLGSINERHGLAVGDITLKRFAEAATGALRDVDIFGRHGGKEFLAILPDTDLKGAIIAARRLCAAVRRETAPEVEERRNMSCTLGVAEHRRGENTRLVIGRAEAALNYAKAAGRDRVVALDADGKPQLIEAR